MVSLLPFLLWFSPPVCSCCCLLVFHCAQDGQGWPTLIPCSQIHTPAAHSRPIDSTPISFKRPVPSATSCQFVVNLHAVTFSSLKLVSSVSCLHVCCRLLGDLVNAFSTRSSSSSQPDQKSHTQLQLSCLVCPLHPPSVSQLLRPTQTQDCV